MTKMILAFVACATLVAGAATMDFKTVPDWLKLPEGRPALGNQHGDVAVSSTGEVYVSVQDPQAGLQVYAPDGTFLRNVPDAPSDLHGFAQLKPELWKPGILVSPHGVAVNAHGDLFVSEFNMFGRVHRFNRQ